jgi:hypothetical protein
VTRRGESEDQRRRMGAGGRGENGEEALTTGEREEAGGAEPFGLTNLEEQGRSESEQNIGFWELLHSFTSTTKHPLRKDGMAPFYLALEPNTT